MLIEVTAWAGLTVGFSMFNELRQELIVHFVDIGGIIDHHCLKLSFYN
jgi:hypothetical protein